MWIPDPVAFHIGPLPVRWYGILISTAFALGTLLACREAKKQNIDPDHILNLVLVIAPLAFLGARLYYVIFYNLPYYLAHPGELLAVWHGGLAIHGGILGGILGGYLVVRRDKLDFWRMADIVAPSLVLGQAIGRWGNFFNQEAYGYETDLPWAMFIDGAYRHPTFLYESLWNMMVFLLLIAMRRKSFMKKGDLFAVYFIFYSLGRLMIESLRTDSLMLGPLRIAQLVSLAGMGAGMAYLFYHHKKKDKAPTSTVPVKGHGKKR